MSNIESLEDYLNQASVEQKVVSVKCVKQPAANNEELTADKKQQAVDNEQCVTKKDLDKLRTDLLNVFSRMKKENRIEFAEHKKQLMDLKSNPEQTDQNKIQRNQFSSTEADLRRSVQEIKESNTIEFAEHKKKINELQTKVDKANKKTNTIQNNNVNTDYKSEIINVFGKSLHDIKEFNKSEFAEISKKFNEKLHNQHSVIETMQAKLDKLNVKCNNQNNEIISLRTQLGKEKKKRITLTERFGKNIPELNLLKQQLISNEKPLFSDNESNFSISTNNSEQNKLIANNIISMSLSNERSTRLPSSQVLSANNLEDNNEGCDTSPQALCSSSQISSKLSSASDSITILTSQESDNNQFDSYLDKTQLYVQQMTISSSNVSLHEADKSLANLQSDEGSISSSNVLLDEESNKKVGVEIKNNNKEIIQYDRDFLLEYQTAPICTSKPAGLPNIDIVLKQAHAPTKALIPGQMLPFGIIGTLSLHLSVQKESGNNEKEYVTQPFLAGFQGYKVQVNAIVRLSQVDVYFLVRLLKGKNDGNQSWPFNQRFCVKLSSKMESTKQVEWYLPSLEGDWKKQVMKPVDNKEVYTEFIGPFDIKEFIDLDELYLEVNPI